MIVLNLDEYNIHKRTILKELSKTLFVYPTDTIYGLGCNATDEKLVSKLRRLKKSSLPLTVIVPNKDWIYNNCVVTEEAEEWIRKLPGPYTLILKLKNKKALANNVYDASNDTIGIRMPNHWFLAVVFQIKVPIITTSANISGDEFMTSLEDLDPMIRNNVDYVFYDGIKRGMPSTIIHLDGSQIKIQPRIERSKNPKIRFPIEEISINK